MASGLEGTIEGCEECGSPSYLRYYVPVTKHLCHGCYQIHQRDILPRELGDENWICSYHDNEFIVLFCITCKCVLCRQCIDDGMHEGHKISSIRDGEKHIREKMNEALVGIAEEERRTLALKDKLIECQERKAVCIAMIEQDMKEKIESEYKAIRGQLAFRAYVIDKEFSKAVKQLEMKRDAKLRIAEEEARESRCQSDKLVKKLAVEISDTEYTLDSRSAKVATLLHERRNILEKKKESVESILESNEEALLMGGLCVLNTCENDSSTGKRECENIQSEIDDLGLSIEQVCKVYTNKNEKQNTTENIGFLQQMISCLCSMGNNIFLTFFLVVFQLGCIFNLWQLFDLHLYMDPSLRMVLIDFFLAVHNISIKLFLSLFFISAIMAVVDFFKKIAKFIISVNAFLFLVLIVCSLVLHPVISEKGAFEFLG